MFLISGQNHLNVQAGGGIKRGASKRPLARLCLKTKFHQKSQGDDQVFSSKETTSGQTIIFIKALNPVLKGLPRLISTKGSKLLSNHNGLTAVLSHFAE